MTVLSMNDTLKNLEISYSRFNAQRTLSSSSESRFYLDHIGGLTLLIDEARSYDNRLLGVCESNIDAVPAALQKFSSLGLRPRIDLEPEALTTKTAKTLNQHGYFPTTSLVFLAMNNTHQDPFCPSPKTDFPSDVRVEIVPHARVDTFLDLLKKLVGLTCDEELWLKRKHLYCTQQFVCFVAYVDGEPCACATLFVEGALGVLANAVTLDSYRGRGCQRALLEARIEHAHSRGIQCTMSDVLPNTTSQRNCQRVGFMPINTRSLWEYVA
ncbi:Acetyltransferase (GNAT) family protein [Pseudovibrio axinellae]|uniref:Acetyltransferase (GNAT) family protein n=1 Tax=Pseudovibrio axinellae TaxID=989403 RepID=A0A161V857_9HYPH|nr:GNAT family N-acetyltransferase [Pseudovibrio axinellae]KZL15348.1 Acetyltransferase (GNAT) family protein [Pseudovibrio axinellae]SER52907.1 hypothetical protein SAMN05421798_1121 [Pseudovibrio axinellae]